MRFTSILIFCIGLTLVFLTGCKDKTDAAKSADERTSGTQPGKESGILNQKPAAEVLGSTVKRNLRYQPEAETNEILSLEEYLEYIRQVGLSLSRQIGKLQPEAPGAGTVVVGLNAEGENRLWYVFPEGKPSDAFKAAAKQAIDDVPKPKLKKSLIVFGVALTLWGYQETEEESAKIQLPKEWKAITDRLKADQPASKLAEMTWDQVVQ